MASFAVWNVPFRVLGEAEARERRLGMRNAIRRAMPWVPAGPIGVGRISDYLWNYFPTDGEPIVSPEQAVGEASACGELVLFFEAPSVPGFVVPGEALGRIVASGEDLYVTPFPGGGPVWVFDHEGYGPWRIDPARRVPVSRDYRRWVRRRVESSWPNVRSDEDAVAYLARNRLSGERLSRRQTASLRRRLLRQLGWKRIDLPPALAQGRDVWDFLWNHLPEVVQIGDRLETAAQLLAGLDSDVALLFESRRCAATILRKGSFVLSDLEPEHLYLVQWPQRRWLLSLPRSFLADPAEAIVQGSFVVLEG